MMNYRTRPMMAGWFMVRSFMCDTSRPNAPMVQACHLIGSVRLEAMITIARGWQLQWHCRSL
jgi:hypothetical protein